MRAACRAFSATSSRCRSLASCTRARVISMPVPVPAAFWFSACFSTASRKRHVGLRRLHVGVRPHRRQVGPRHLRRHLLRGSIHVRPGRRHPNLRRLKAPDRLKSKTLCVAETRASMHVERAHERRELETRNRGDDLDPLGRQVARQVLIREVRRDIRQQRRARLRRSRLRLLQRLDRKPHSRVALRRSRDFHRALQAQLDRRRP